jgi:hypothetical protein
MPLAKIGLTGPSKSSSTELVALSTSASSGGKPRIFGKAFFQMKEADPAFAESAFDRVGDAGIEPATPTVSR